jgi:hypothetical protein
LCPGGIIASFINLETLARQKLMRLKQAKGSPAVWKWLVDEQPPWS